MRSPEFFKRRNGKCPLTYRSHPFEVYDTPKICRRVWEGGGWQLLEFFNYFLPLLGKYSKDTPKKISSESLKINWQFCNWSVVPYTHEKPYHGEDGFNDVKFDTEPDMSRVKVNSISNALWISQRKKLDHIKKK